MKQSPQQPIPDNILEKGYRPVGRLNTQNPPQGRSAVPSKPAAPEKDKNS